MGKGRVSQEISTLESHIARETESPQAAAGAEFSSYELGTISESYSVKIGCFAKGRGNEASVSTEMGSLKFGFIPNVCFSELSIGPKVRASKLRPVSERSSAEAATDAKTSKYE